MSQIRFEEQQYNTESLDAGLWKRIFVLMRPLRKELVRLLILMVAVAGCDVLFPILNKIAIDTFAAGGQPDSSLWMFSGVYMAGVLFQAFSVYLFFMQAGKIEMAFSYDVRQKAFAKLQTLSFSYFDRTQRYRPAGGNSVMESDGFDLGFSGDAGGQRRHAAGQLEAGVAGADGRAGAGLAERVVSGSDSQELPQRAAD